MKNNQERESDHASRHPNKIAKGQFIKSTTGPIHKFEHQKLYSSEQLENYRYDSSNECVARLQEYDGPLFEAPRRMSGLGIFDRKEYNLFLFCSLIPPQVHHGGPSAGMRSLFRFKSCKNSGMRQDCVHFLNQFIDFNRLGYEGPSSGNTAPFPDFILLDNSRHKYNGNGTGNRILR